ncbi:MAG: OmpA family protein [Myxococcales bacterium]|nr:OmpA family protein [Myxococcales bacterium]
MSATISRARSQLAVAILLFFASPSLVARENANTNRFHPALNSKGLALTESGELLRHLGWTVALLGNYAYKPVVFVDANGDTTRTLVSHRTMADLVIGLGLFGWVELSLDLPLVISQDGYRPQDPATPLQKFSVGDLRLSLKAALLRPKRRNLALSFQLTSSVPTAPSQNSVGERVVALNPMLNLSYFNHLFVAFNIGATLRTRSVTVGDVRFSHELDARLGIGYRFQPANLTLFTEATISTPLSGRIFQHKEETPAEWLAGVRWQIGYVHLLAGGGIGIIRGVGTPTARAFLGIAVSNDIGDRDGDGIPDGADRCPDDPEDKDGFEDSDGCPDPDNDKDGICDPWVAKKGLLARYANICKGIDRCPDDPEDKDGFQDDDGCPDPDNDKDGICDPWVAEKGLLERYRSICRGIDRCPNEPEDKDGFQDDDGCPDLDNDLDGIEDRLDKCPNEPEDWDGFQDDDGCPDPDNDNDRIPDLRDQCPDHPETYNGIDDTDGCPDQLAELKDTEIKIYTKVYFETASSTIRSRSYPVLNQVAAIINAHPELKQIRIEGHTDVLGGRRYNLHLSFFRAKAVFLYLTQKRGVKKGRLIYKGYGFDRPIALGRDAASLSKNRRVEFKIVKRTAK